MKNLRTVIFLLTFVMIVIAPCAFAQEQDLDEDMRIPTTVIYVMPAPAPEPGTIFPEYCPGHPIVAETPYSAPDFKGKRCFWVKEWNAFGYFAETLPDAIGQRPVATGAWDGIAYDGHLLVDPPVKDDIVYFNLSMKDGHDVKRYFYASQLSEDPRITNWWMKFVNDSFPTLWNAVERVALSEDHPDITQAIIDHMTACEVIQADAIQSMSPSEIHSALVAYTDIALTHHADRVRSLLANDRLTEEKFQSLTCFDTLHFYFSERFGPSLEPRIHAVVMDNQSGIITASEVNSDDYFTCSWEDLAWIAEFIWVAKSSRSY